MHAQNVGSIAYNQGYIIWFIPVGNNFSIEKFSDSFRQIMMPSRVHIELSRQLFHNVLYIAKSHHSELTFLGLKVETLSAVPFEKLWAGMSYTLRKFHVGVG